MKCQGHLVVGHVAASKASLVGSLGDPAACLGDPSACLGDPAGSFVDLAASMEALVAAFSSIEAVLVAGLVAACAWIAGHPGRVEVGPSLSVGPGKEEVAALKEGHAGAS